ncbi:MAG: hypothetical protein J0M36_13205 [Caulobacterales bacterium]|nr:hypothetical protein [Caulobacterales bacterium]
MSRQHSIRNGRAAWALDGWPTKTLHVACDRALETLVSCRLRTFLSLDVSARVQLSIQDFDETEPSPVTDVLLRQGGGRPLSGWAVQLTARDRYVLVAAPDVARDIAPEVIPILADRFSRIRDRSARYLLLNADGGASVSTRLISNDSAIVLAAAMEGLGVAALPELMCGAAVWEGRLQLVSGLEATTVIELATPARATPACATHLTARFADALLAHTAASA